MRFNPDKKEVYRIDILKRAKYLLKRHKVEGICSAITCACRDYNIHIPYFINTIFKLLNYNIAKNNFNATGIDKQFYWWKPGRFHIFSDRRKYVNWLIEQYKNDKKDLRKISFNDKKFIKEYLNS